MLATSVKPQRDNNRPPSKHGRPRISETSNNKVVNPSAPNKSTRGRPPIKAGNYRGNVDTSNVDTTPLLNGIEDVIGLQRIQEKPTFLSCSPRRRDQMCCVDFSLEWLTFGTPMKHTDTEPDFIEADSLEKYFKLKDDIHKTVFDEVKRALHKRANPYEDLGRFIFVCRNGPKIASMDKMFDFAITDESKFRKRNEKTIFSRRSNALSRNEAPFTFVDISGAPGGFTDYILWRKSYYNAKGFVALVNNKKKFSYRTEYMLPGHPEFLDFHKSPVGESNLDCTENVDSFVNHVKSELIKHETVKAGDEHVNFVGAFGCYYPDGREMMQEIRHHKLFLGNCLAGLSLAKPESGNMLIRVFDMFTPVTVGLVYCLYLSFSRIAIVKPVSCRPKNTEQFIFCQNLTPFGATIIKEYLASVLKAWDDLTEDQTVSTIVPLAVMKDDIRFNDYITNYNKITVTRQMRYIDFYNDCMKNPRLAVPNAIEIRNLALKHWELGPFKRSTQQQRFPPPVEFVVGTRADKSWNTRDFCAAPSEFIPDNFDASTQFFMTELDFPTTKFALIAIDSNNIVFYLLNPDVGFVETQFTGPAYSVFLVENNPSLMDSNMKKLVIHDAAVLADDNIAHLPLSQRLKAAQKFAKTALIRRDKKAVLLQIAKCNRVPKSKIKPDCRISRVLPVTKDDNLDLCDTMSVMSFSSRVSQRSQKGGRNMLAERFWTSLTYGNSWMKSA